MSTMELALIMPLHTAEVERGFSAQNNIVIASRNRISASTVNKLMLIKCEGANVKDYNFGPAVNNWRQTKKRRIYSMTKK